MKRILVLSHRHDLYRWDAINGKWKIKYILGKRGLPQALIGIDSRTANIA